jgi:5'-nucleotidase
MTRILVDLDDTIADWSARYDWGLDTSPGAENIPRSAELTGFDLFADRTPAEKRIILAVMAEWGFYADLVPIDGAIEALHEMAHDGFEVFIVTSPWPANPTCASDKLRWVEKHLGFDWSKRTIITADKTVVRGDVLFDDKGNITGIDTPTWRQVLVTQPHNRSVSTLPRLNNWAHWGAAVLGVVA